MRATAITTLVLVLTAGCGRFGYHVVSDLDGQDGGFDAGVLDAGIRDFDARNPIDAGAPMDSGSSDAGPDDGGAFDSGVIDAGMLDAGPPDAGPPDAGPRDAGPPDAGPRDAGPRDAGPRDAGPPPFVCPAGALTCEDFEDGVSAPWFDDCPAAMLAGRGRNGTAGLGTQPPSCTIEYTPPTPFTLGQDIYVRFYARFQTTGDEANVVVLFGPENDQVAVRWTEGTSMQIYLQGGLFGASDGPIPTMAGRYSCVQFHMRHAVAGRVDVAVDGVPIAAINGDTTFEPEWVRVVVGGNERAGSGRYDMDELVVSRSPIACD